MLALHNPRPASTAAADLIQMPVHHNVKDVKSGHTVKLELQAALTVLLGHIQLMQTQQAKHLVLIARLAIIPTKAPTYV